MDSPQIGSTLEPQIYYELRLDKKQASKRIPKKLIDLGMSHDYNPNLLAVLFTACRKARTYTSVTSIDGFLNIMAKIVTSDCLGSQKNVKGFLKLVKLKMYSSLNECIYKNDILLDFDINDFQYFAEHLKNDFKKCEDLFLEVILWLFANIVDRLMYRNFRNLTIGNMKQNYVTRSEHESFYAKATNDLLKKKFIEIVSNISKCEGKLCFIAKKSVKTVDKYRVIYKRFWTEKSSLENDLYIKDINNYINQEARIVCSFVQIKEFHLKWLDYVSKIGNRNIYGVKLDLNDAFGNVKIDELYKLIENTQRFSRTYLAYIKSINTTTKIEFGKRDVCYKWSHGLLQGQRLSTSLFALYRSHQDKRFLWELNTPNAFIFRVVDDYLYFNTNPTLVKRFLEIMMHNNDININKTTLILPENIENKSNVIFNGANIDLKTKKIKIAYAFEEPLHHRYKIWNIKRPIINRWTLVQNQTVFQANSIYFSKIFHFIYNDRDTKYYNFFSGMILVAHRFDCVLQSIHHPFEITQDKIHTHINKTVNEYANNIKRLWRICPNKGHRSLLRKVGLKAFLLVLQRRHHAYTETICNLKRDINAIVLMKIGAHIFYKTCRSIPNEYSQICIHRKINERR